MIRLAPLVLIAFLIVVLHGVPPEARTDAQKSEWQRAMALLAEGDARAIDLMKSAFADEQGPRTRQQIASTLVTLRVPDDRYYDFLVEFARQAVERDTPAPMADAKSFGR